MPRPPLMSLGKDGFPEAEGPFKCQKNVQGRCTTFIAHRFNLCAGLRCDSLTGNRILSALLNYTWGELCLNNLFSIRNLHTAMFMKSLSPNKNKRIDRIAGGKFSCTFLSTFT